MTDRKIGRRDVLTASLSAACFSAVAACGEARADAQHQPALYRTQDPSELKAAVATILALDVHGVLATVDTNGMPRLRSMSVNASDDFGRFWMATRPGSRKLDQIAANEKATLHFVDTEQWGYVTFMGTIATYTDPKVIDEHFFFYDELREQLFPEYPDDVVMLALSTEWLEIAGRGVRVRPMTWQPQGLRVSG